MSHDREEALRTIARYPRTRTSLLEQTPCGWGVNPYVLCDHRCSYCVTGVKGASQPVLPKDRIVEALARELPRVPVDASIAFGGLSDAYPHAEEELGVSRALLPTLLSHGASVTIVTKGLGVRRDVDLLRGCSHVSVMVSIGIVDDARARPLEPFAPPPSERLSMVRWLKAQGIHALISASPWVPGASDLEALLAVVDDDVLVTAAPLNVQFQEKDGRRFGAPRSQGEIDAAYLQEMARLGTPDNLAWLHPPTDVVEHCLKPISWGRLHDLHFGRVLEAARARAQAWREAGGTAVS